MIEVKNLVKSFDGHLAVNDLSFTVERGQIVGFLGPNGAGKSTTMNMITGYISSTHGSIVVNGHDIYDEPEKAKKAIGYLPEQPPLYPDMRVREYLAFVAELKKVKKSERLKMMHDIMTQTKILDVSERLIKHLSKGYKQRVGLAGAMMGYPEILILDEPTVGLDPMQIIEIRELIKKLSEKHTILLSSHIMQEVSAVCNTIMIINQGKLVVSDTPENIAKQMNQTNDLHLLVKGTQNEIETALSSVQGIISLDITDTDVKDLSEVTISSNVEDDLREAVFFAMANNQYPIYEMSMNEMTLEDIFLQLTKGGTKQFGGKEDKKSFFKKREKVSAIEEAISDENSPVDTPEDLDEVNNIEDIANTETDKEEE